MSGSEWGMFKLRTMNFIQVSSEVLCNGIDTQAHSSSSLSTVRIIARQGMPQ